MQRLSKNLCEKIEGRAALNHKKLAEKQVFAASVFHQGKLFTAEQLLVGTPKHEENTYIADGFNILMNVKTVQTYRLCTSC